MPILSTIFVSARHASQSLGGYPAAQVGWQSMSATAGLPGACTHIKESYILSTVLVRSFSLPSPRLVAFRILGLVLLPILPNLYLLNQILPANHVLPAPLPLLLRLLYLQVLALRHRTDTRCAGRALSPPRKMESTLFR